VHLSPEARRAFAAWYEDNQRLTMAALPGMAGVYAKLPNQVARLALALHCLTYPDDPRRPLSEATMDGAIELGEYFRAHAHRVQTHFGLAAPTAIVELEARIVRALEREGGWASRRRLHALLGGHVPATDLSAALESLKQQGIVECQMIATASKPTEVWSLVQPLAGTELVRVNEQSPWQVDAIADSSDSSYARDACAISRDLVSGKQVELF